MATTKAKSAKKTASKKTSAKSKTASSKAKNTAKSVAAKTTKKEKVTTVEAAEKNTAEEKVVTTKIIASAEVKKENSFFARKGDKNENILTIFKDTKIISAIVGEVIGTGLVTAIALTLGLMNPLYLIFGYIGITAAIFKLSGAHFNPIITAGMMASRRVSAIRGVLYLIAQVLGAWIAFMIINAFYNVGLASGNIDAASTILPSLTPASEVTATTTEGFNGFFWAITMLEFIGAIIIAFFYARALDYKRGVYSFAAIVGSGVFLALLFAVIISGTYLGVSDNVFVFNPAAALMYGLLPSSADGFDALMEQLMPMLTSYVIFPVIGGIVGFYLSDILAKIGGHEYAN